MKEFSLESFAVMLAEKAVALNLAMTPAMEAAAQHVERTAKAKFGEYQGNVGAFNEWQQLAASTQTERVRQGYTPNDPLLRSGDLRDSITHEVHGLEAVIGSDDEIMVYQELGTERIPPRPVLGPAGIESGEMVAKLLGSASVGWLIGSGPNAGEYSLSE